MASAGKMGGRPSTCPMSGGGVRFRLSQLGRCKGRTCAIDSIPRHWDSESRELMRYLLFNLLVVAALSAAPGKQTFNGIVTDDNCPKANHSQMRMGPTDAECAMACIDVHGAVYGLYDGNHFYTLSDQRAAEKFVGKKVRVTGTLDTRNKTIKVDSITVKK
jgi:hypothetical protein